MLSNRPRVRPAIKAELKIINEAAEIYMRPLQETAILP
jgi:hypothetical protein